MRTYRYSALTNEGLQKKGVVKALDEFEAVDKIKATYPVVTKINPVKETNSILDMEVGSSKVAHKHLAVMCSQFAIILKSGVGIARAMAMIAEQTEDKKLKKMLVASVEDISEGMGIADTMERHGQGLPMTFIETVRAGERSGTLANSFKAMETYFTRSQKTNQKVKQALTYPIFVVIVAIIVLIIVMAKVIPTLSAVFKDFGGELPAMTRVLIKTSEFFAAHWLFIMVIIGAIIAGLKLSALTEKGQVFWSNVVLKTPIIGKINLLTGSSQFATTMAVLLTAGLSIDDAIQTTAKSMTNRTLGDEVGRMTLSLQEGKSLGECIRRCNYFPNTLKEMCAIGEETGELEDTLLTIGDYYDNEASYAMQQAISKLEPTLLVFLALFAGFIVIAIYLPIFTMYNFM
ncbi:type II secretion system protein F (GspF) [Granulicatella balaenopterae]|uniref:Type II secretion system protein F (GspF) n=1 Tax=Granulicatella balaenopterae TaxID=137733 RepID=A0A1H9KQC2_9LACT|nr:type II secretion system F family protein [Granulicatella balaenopterae]SER01356.1 type II secretion system protein F (GspF) [Granulicatella balaenopterae]